jgi:ABC-type glycerol-3-phosphate transport system substrate-binding protein
MKRTKMMVTALLITCMLILSGCGGPKADVSIFMMGQQGIPSDISDKLKSALTAKVGPTPTIDFQSSPIFSIEKLIVTLAAGEADIAVVPDEQFKGMGVQGGFVPLDDLVKQEDYQGGILEATNDGKTEKHLYGIPLEDTKWMKEQKLNGKGLIAFIPQNSKVQDKAKQVLKIIAEK